MTPWVHFVISFYILGFRSICHIAKFATQDVRGSLELVIIKQNVLANTARVGLKIGRAGGQEVQPGLGFPHYPGEIVSEDVQYCRIGIQAVRRNSALLPGRPCPVMVL